MDLDTALALALRLCDLADGITMARFRARDLAVETKPDLTPVSEADRAVEQAIRAQLDVEAPDHVVLGEEYGEDAADGAAEFRWIVDPIDGTKNYVRGVPIWATLVALEHRGQLDVGVVSAPALHTRWWAARGKSAFRDGDRIGVSRVADVADAHVAYSWDTGEAFVGEGLGDRLLELSEQAWRTRGIGDFWQHVLVADGSFDVGIDPVVSRWDIAALIPIVEEAGGRWTDRDGRQDTSGDRGFVSTNGLLHDAVLAAMGPTGRSVS